LERTLSAETDLGNCAVELRKKKHELRNSKKHLTALTNSVATCLRAMDEEMAKPSSPERGSRIAKISNALNLQNDIARRFGLGQR
jgi:hypothetical protein